MSAPSRPTEAELRAGTAMAYGGDKPVPKLQVISFKRMRRNTLRGFVSVQFSSGLRLLDCPVHVRLGGRTWVALPGKPLVGEDGRQKRDANGKTQYVPMAEWRDHATGDRFSELVIALLLERFPNALDERAP
jgi:hypothetical protein